MIELENFEISDPEIPTYKELYPEMKKKWDRQKDAAIDQWPKKIADLSVETHLIKIENIEFEAIFNRYENPEGWHRVMTKYADKIDAITGWDDYFVRLSTRSPKDSAYPHLPITMSGKQAMMWISTSERCLDDLFMARCAQQQMYIALRKKYEVNESHEFRCFVKNHELIAVSRYHYDKEAEMDYSQYPIFERLKEFSAQHIVPHYQNIVFDVELGCVGRGGLNGTPLLIEVNPYGLSDPCLFKSYEKIEKEGGFRF